VAGRDKKYDKLLDLVADGDSLTAACKAVAPKKHGQFRRQFYHALVADPELALNYARVLLLDADRTFERIEEALEDGVTVADDKKGDPATLNARVHARKNLADGLKWIAARKNRRKYGDKLDLDVDGKVTHTFADLAKKADE